MYSIGWSHFLVTFLVPAFTQNHSVAIYKCLPIFSKDKIWCGGKDVNVDQSKAKLYCVVFDNHLPFSLPVDI